MLNMTETQFKQTIDDVISKNGIVLGLCRDVDGLKQDFAKLGNEVHRQGLIQEDMQKDLRTIVQAITSLS